MPVEDYYNKNLRDRARYLRSNMTFFEKKLWFEFLRTFPLRAHRQRAIGNYIVDFYIPKADLVIEIDGDSHFTEDGIREDQIRTAELNRLNLRFLRFTNTEIRDSFEFVCEKIQEVVKTAFVSE